MRCYYFVFEILIHFVPFRFYNSSKILTKKIHRILSEIKKIMTLQFNLISNLNE